MTLNLIQPIPQIDKLPNTLPREGAANIELEEGVLVLRVSQMTQERIEELMDKQQQQQLSIFDEAELTQYENLDDYLSFINRLSRNLIQIQN